MSGAVFIDCSAPMWDLLTPARRAIFPNLEVHKGDPSAEDLLSIIGTSTAVLNGHTQMTEDTLQRAPNLQRIVFLGSGPASYIDMQAAARLDIEVLKVAGYGNVTIAEHAIALMFAVSRNITLHDRDLRAGLWQPLPGRQLAGSTLAVIGAGGVGQEMVKLGLGLGMQVVYTSRQASPHLPGAECVSLSRALKVADVVSIHLAQTPETIGYIGADELSAMKPGALLINTSRGALVDESALMSALASGHIAGAGLDVFESEPLRPDDPLLAAQNVVLTPHVAFNTPQASANLLEKGLRLLSTA